MKRIIKCVRHEKINQVKYEKTNHVKHEKDKSGQV